MITLKQLLVFVKVAEHGHMGDAADSLGLSQPALSQQMRLLEERLDLKLFERIPRGMQATPSARELLPKAQAVLSAMHEFGEVADRAAERPVGTIRFGVTPTIGPYLMPGVVRSLHQKFPTLRIYIREGIPALQHAELAAGELDMVLSPLPIAGRSLHVEPLFREPLRIVAPPDDPLCGVPERSEQDFSGRTFLTIDRRHHYHEQLRSICGELGATILADYEGTSLDALRQMAGSGVGLAVLPELYVLSEAGGLDVVRIVDPVGWNKFRSIGVAWRTQAAFATVYQEISAVIADEARSKLAPIPNRGPDNDPAAVSARED